MPKPSTISSWEESQKRLKRQSITIRTADFFEHWAPKDPEEAARFHAEFVYLIQEVYAEAMSGMHETIAGVLHMYLSSKPSIAEPKDDSTP
jgi:hypothetical protein